jgi:hypothetical protein
MARGKYKMAHQIEALTDERDSLRSDLAALQATVHDHEAEIKHLGDRVEQLAAERDWLRKAHEALLTITQTKALQAQTTEPTTTPEPSIEPLPEPTLVAQSALTPKPMPVPTPEPTPTLELVARRLSWRERLKIAAIGHV